MTGRGGIDFDDLATLTGSDLTLGSADAAAPFVNAVDYFDPMQITWSVQPAGMSAWVPAGVTANAVYVVLAHPDLPTTQRWHTLFRNSCRDAAGATTDAQVLAGVWSDFTDRVVMRADPDANGLPVQLTYYDQWVCGNFTTQSLLATGDGQCGAWARLLLDMLRAHGIDHLNEYVTVYYVHPTSGDFGFLVNDWTFVQGAGNSPDPAFPYLNIPPLPPAEHIVNGAYVWRFADVTDAAGVPGQGTANPLSWFLNHQVVRIAGVYYDPSYGETYSSLDAIDSGAVAAHYKRETITVVESEIGVDLNSDGDTDDTLDATSFLIDANPVGNQIEENISDYPFP